MLNNYTKSDDPESNTPTNTATRLHLHPSGLHGKKTLGQRWADTFSNFVGSWKFILGYMAVTILWVTVNIIPHIFHYDGYPFQFYTFSVSVLAILMTALVLLAQNRAAEIDRAHAENSYAQVEEIDTLQKEQMDVLGCQTEEIARLKDIQEALANLTERIDKIEL